MFVPRGGGYGLRLNRPGETLETSQTISFPVSRGAAIGNSRDGIPYENKARSSIRNVYAVAKETSSAESHPGASQVRKDILESGKCGGVVVSQLSIHARPLIRRQRYGHGYVPGRRLQFVANWVRPPAIELLREVVILTL